MDFKVKILCDDCKCSFELRPHDFKQRENIECPNCGNKLPDDVFSNLKIGITALGAVPEKTPLLDGMFRLGEDTHQFCLSVESYSFISDTLDAI